MKAKLLKIVRKRYSIEKINGVSSDASKTYKEMVKSLGYPFYSTKDMWDTYNFRSNFFSSYEDAVKRVWKMILEDYGEKFRHKDADTSKVWWIGDK